MIHYRWQISLCNELLSLFIVVLLVFIQLKYSSEKRRWRVIPQFSYQRKISKIKTCVWTFTDIEGKSSVNTNHFIWYFVGDSLRVKFSFVNFVHRFMRMISFNDLKFTLFIIYSL